MVSSDSVSMARLHSRVRNSPGSIPGIDIADLDGSLRKAYKSIVAGKLSDADKSIRPYLAEGSRKDAEQVAQARKLDEHLTDRVNGILNAIQDVYLNDDVTIA